MNKRQNPSAGTDCNEDSTVDIGRIPEEAGDKEKKVKMHHGWQYFNNQRNREATRNECTDSRPLMGNVMCWLCNFGVLTCPVLRRYRNYGSCKADKQAREPE